MTFAERQADMRLHVTTRVFIIEFEDGWAVLSDTVPPTTHLRGLTREQAEESRQRLLDRLVDLRAPVVDDDVDT